jgi:hypothetical protein
MIRGATYEIEITVSDKDTGDPINLTNAEGILVGVYGEGKRIFGKFSLIAKQGYGDVIVTNAVGGVLKVYLEASDTLKAIPKNSFVEIKIALPNGVYEDNVQINIATEVELESVQSSIFEGISPL